MPKTEAEIDAEMAELQSEIDKMNAEEEQIKKDEEKIANVIDEEMQDLEDFDDELLAAEEEEEDGESEGKGGDTSAIAEESGPPDGTKDENKGDGQDGDSYLEDIESELQVAQSACTKAKASIPSGFELRTDTAEEIDAVNEGCCLGMYATDADCRAAIPQVECDVHRVCAEADELADKLTGGLRNNVEAAEKKCREGAAGILEEKDDDEEEPYDNVDDLNIIRMKCCLAPFDADLVECEDDARVEAMRTENRCDLLEWCLEASRLEGQIDEDAQTLLDNIAEPTQNQDDDGYFTSPHVGGRDGDKKHEKEKKTKFDKTKGLGGSKNPFGFADGGSSSNSGGSSSSGGMWAGLMVGLLCCALLILFVSKRSKQSAKRSSGASGPKDKRFTRRPMPSHNSHKWEDEDPDPEYGEHSHSDVGIGDDSSFAPALAGLFSIS